MFRSQELLAHENKCKEILNIYPNGMESLLEVSCPKYDEPYLILIFNCDNNFYEKYRKRAQRKFEAAPMEISYEQINQGSELDSSSNNSNNSFTISFTSENEAPIFKQPRKSNPPLEEIYSNINESKKYLNIIRKVLREITKFDESFIDVFLKEYSKRKSEKIITENKSYYDECLNVYKHYNWNNNSINKQSNNDDSSESDDEDFFLYANTSSSNQKKRKDEYEFYTEITYEDYILILCSFIKYQTELDIHFQLSDEQTFLLIYGNEKTYEKLAEKYRYDLQLKNYAFKYEYDKQKKNKKVDDSYIDFKPTRQTTTTALNESITTDIDDLLSESACSSGSNILGEKLIDSYQRLPQSFPNLQFYKLKLHNQLHFPPYLPFRIEKKEKFRTYEKDDNYHDCNNDPDFNKVISGKCQHECSIFRNIDKLRLINISVEKVINFSFLEKEIILKKFIYKQNYTEYESKLSVASLFHNNTKIFSNTNTMYLIHTIRNYYGEYLSFYFLWVSYFCKWLIFPGLFGMILFLIKTLHPTTFETDLNTIGNFKLKYYEIASILYAVFIITWASFYLKAWKQKEQIFSYIWGMENYIKKEPADVNFKPNKKQSFLFNEKIHTVTKLSFYFRRAISFIVLAIMIALRVLLTYYIKQENSKENITFQKSIIVSLLSGIISKTMSIIYEYLAKVFSKWENHEKYSQRQNSLAFKLVMFEFVNNYSVLYYIALYKPMKEISCLYNDCSKELEIQLYMLLLINFSFNLYEVGYPYIVFKWNEKKSKKHHILQMTSIHSEDHQLLRKKYNTLIYEYNERLISFGFVCLFSVAAPLTPIFVFVFTFLENYFDLYKIVHLSRVEVIEGSSGIEVFNSVFRLFYLIGMVTSTALVLFNKPKVLNIKFDDENWREQIFTNNEFVNRILVFAILENVIFIFGGIGINTLPTWFLHLDEFKSVYKRKYYNRQRKELPHITKEDENEEEGFGCGKGGS